MHLKLNFESLEVKRKINLLAEICFYGIEWNRDLPPESDGGYIIGGIETTAHILACCIVQWFGFDCCGTAETRDFLKMEVGVKQKKRLSIDDWERRIVNYLKTGVDGQQN